VVSSLRQALEDYLRMRRALGYKLERPGRQLGQFVTYLEETGAQTVTIENAVAWATQPAEADPSYWSERLSLVRQFARHLQTIDPACEVPPARLLPYGSRRAIPYPYSREEIAALMRVAAELPSPPMAATYRTLLGLLAVGGLRLGEAIGLDRDDVDARHGLVRVVNSKFGKSREVPLAESAMRALGSYSRRRDQLCPQPTSEAFFLSTAGTRLHRANVQRVFSRLKREVGLTPRSPRCRPRLHDLRHRFAVNTLIDWYHAGVDVQALLPLLSTYIGHSEPSDTYWRPRLRRSSPTGCSASAASARTRSRATATPSGCCCRSPNRRPARHRRGSRSQTSTRH
jgi:integrase